MPCLAAFTATPASRRSDLLVLVHGMPVQILSTLEREVNRAQMGAIRGDLESPERVELQGGAELGTRVGSGPARATAVGAASSRQAEQGLGCRLGRVSSRCRSVDDRSCPLDASARWRAASSVVPLYGRCGRRRRSLRPRSPRSGRLCAVLQARGWSRVHRVDAAADSIDPSMPRHQKVADNGANGPRCRRAGAARRRTLSAVSPRGRRGAASASVTQMAASSFRPATRSIARCSYPALFGRSAPFA